MFSLDLPLIFAFSAGLVAAFNPCGAAMFPAYVGYQLDAVQYSSSPVKSGLRAVVLGLSATAGFVVVFGTVGIILAAGGKAVDTFLPFVGLGVGVIITIVGLYLLISRRKIGIMAASRVNLGHGKGIKSVFLFGIGYALASLSCALAVYLTAVGVVVGQSLSTGAVAQTIIVSVTYGLGMGTVLVAATVGIVFFKGAVEKGIRVARPYIEPIGNLAMVGAGIYLIYYWLLGDGRILLTPRASEIFG
jgi:cytochrome c biogenesis protein CcdA